MTASSSVYPVESAAMRRHAAHLSNYDNNGSSGAAIHGPDPSSSGDAVNGSDGIKLSQQHTAAGQQEDNTRTNTNTNKDTTSSDGSVINGGCYSYSYSPFEVVARTRTRSGASGRSPRETSTASAESSGADQEAAGAECTSPGDSDGGPDSALAFREALLFGEGSDAGEDLHNSLTILPFYFVLSRMAFISLALKHIRNLTSFWLCRDR